MQASKLTSGVWYTITPTETGVNLCVWESARTTEIRDKPFLFKINYRLPSHTEAQKLLGDYLENLG